MAEGFSAMSFWKNVEKKNISISFTKERPQPKKLNFPLLQPPPAPEDEAATSVLVKSEWDDQNVTGAFDFWKKKAIEVQVETEKYNARRNRNTVDLTNLLANSTSSDSLSGQPTSIESITISSPDGAPISPKDGQPSEQSNVEQDAADGMIRSASSSSIRDFRRSRSISCEVIPTIGDGSSTTTTATNLVGGEIVTEQLQQAQQAAQEQQEKQARLEEDESLSSDEESDLSSDEEEEMYSDEEDMIGKESDSPASSDSPNLSPNFTETATIAAPAASSIHSISQIKEDNTYKLDVQSPVNSNNNIPDTNHQQQQLLQQQKPSSSVQQPTSTNSAAASNSNNNNNNITPNKNDSRPVAPSIKKDSSKQEKRSIGATLTRTMTKTFNKPPVPSTSSTGTTPTGTPTGKKEKVKVDKHEKERLKQEKRDLKKKEREQKKQAKKKNITKSLSLTDMKSKVSIDSQPKNIFKVRLSKLVASNGGNLPPFITQSITFLSNSENVDVSYIFLDAFNDPTVKALRLKADNEPIDFNSITSPRIVGGLLRIFFSELPQPLFNTKFYEDLMDIQDITKPEVKLHDLRSIIWTLSHLRRNLLQLFVTFLTQKYINSSPTKNATVGILASTFGAVFFRSADPKIASIHQLQREETMRLVLENSEFLFDEHEQSDLVYGNTEGKMLVREASVDALIEKATDVFYHHADKYFTLTFFMTHHYFISASDLVDRLVQLYKETNRAESKKKWKKTRGGKRATKINEAVKLWVDYCYRELREDKKLAQRILKGFPHLEAQLSSRLTQSRFNALSDILRVPKFHNRTRSASFSDSLLASGAMSKDPSLVAMEIAEQATIVDWDLFSNIRLSDWVRLLQGSVDPTQCPYLANALKKSTTWCQWSMGEILQVEDRNQRVQVINLLVEIAIYCRELSNYNTCIGILNAFNNHHVKRLTATWDAVPAETRSKIDRLQQSLLLWTTSATQASATAQFSAICQSISSACVPHFGTLRAVLQAFDATMPTKSADNLRINVEKLRVVFATVVEMQRIQQRPYSLKPSKLSIQLQDLQAPTMEELAEMSLVVEPPAASKKYTAPVEVAVENWREQIVKSFVKPVAQTAVGIDLPRLACFFSVGGHPTTTNTNSKVADIQAAIAALSRLTSDEETAKTANYEGKIADILPLTTPNDSDIKRDLLRYLEEVIGADSLIVSLLKCCNQAILAPAVIELTLNIAKGIQFMDAFGSWRIEIDKTDNNYVVRHIKRQKSRSSQAKDQFEFEWSLSLTLDQTCKSIQQYSINIHSITFSPDTAQSLKDQIKLTLSPYLLTQDCINENQISPPPTNPTTTTNNNTESL